MLPACHASHTETQRSVTPDKVSTTHGVGSSLSPSGRRSSAQRRTALSGGWASHRAARAKARLDLGPAPRSGNAVVDPGQTRAPKCDIMTLLRTGVAPAGSLT